MLAGLISGKQDELSALAGEQLAHQYLDLTRPAAVRPLVTLDAIASLDADTPLQWRDGLHGSVIADGPDTVTVLLPTKSVSFPAVCEPALRAVLDGTPVTAGALPGVDADDGLVVLRRLLREAVLVAM